MKPLKSTTWKLSNNVMDEILYSNKHRSKFMNYNQTFIPYFDVSISSRDLRQKKLVLSSSKSYLISLVFCSYEQVYDIFNTSRLGVILQVRGHDGMSTPQNGVAAYSQSHVFARVVSCCVPCGFHLPECPSPAAFASTCALDKIWAVIFIWKIRGKKCSVLYCVRQFIHIFMGPPFPQIDIIGAVVIVWRARLWYSHICAGKGR